MDNNNDKAKTTQQQLEDNLRNFQPQKSEAVERAKRILFGRTDIGDEKKENPDYELNTGRIDKIPMVATVKTTDPSTIGNPSTDWDELNKLAEKPENYAADEEK